MACILGITEDLDTRRAWRRLFVYAGYAVMDARHVQEGLHYLQTHVIDLVVLELVWSAPDARATLQALRTGAPTIPLLLLVDFGVLDQPAGELLRPLHGAHRVLTSPVAEATLLAVVRELLAMP